MHKPENISLSSTYKHKKSDRDIFEELMPVKVKEVLLIATLYDSYSIIREGQFTERIYGDFSQLNLYTYPRFTSVNSKDEAIEMMRVRAFDLVIIMVGVDKNIPVKIANAIYEENNKIPVLLLLNNNGDLPYFQKTARQFDSIDRVFVWNGNSNVFLAMIKYIEDKKNIKADTKTGNVRVILLVEDSIQYYSRYLPMLYTNIMTQTQNLVKEESTDDLHMILKMRARPKVILVSTFEEAIEIVNKYKEYLLTVISDIKYLRNNIDDENAGFNLLKYIKETLRYPIPTLLQSQDNQNKVRAEELGASFINKNSESLSLDIHNYIFTLLGFGDFVFKNEKGEEIMVAHNLNEFQEMFKVIPGESLIYHGKRNSFSTWLMARGEINIAERLLPYKFEDFANPEEVRRFCLHVFEKTREEKLRGHLISFDPALPVTGRYVNRMGNGSLGGKGRGISFMCHFIENIDFQKIIPNLNIRIPATVIIGSEEFDKFLEINQLYEEIYNGKDYEHVKSIFLKSKLSNELQEKLRLFIENTEKPLAVRSSGLFEDSLLQPFSGVYATYLIPNNSTDISIRYNQLETAIKLVYASIFTESAVSYFDAVNYQIEEEKMAVVIQTVVGHEHNGRIYPCLSGIAQSYNFYPVSHMKPEDGFAIAAVGLGMYVVGGENAYRFCPKYPTINHSSVKDQVRDSQREFYALDLTDKEIDLATHGEKADIVKLPIKEAEIDGVLKHCASVYDPQNDNLVPGLDAYGPRVVNFANILKYNYIPLSETLQVLLNYFREAMGSPVEMEYAIDITPDNDGFPTFYLLQIKPLIRVEEDLEIELGEIGSENTLMYAKNGMGNGILEGIHDVIYISNDKFDKTKTSEIATEINRLNKIMESSGRDYILIGPGRWGSRDKFIGIPVDWSHISKARIIIEMGLKDYPLEGSLGSHFFHNVTSMNIGYFSIPYNSQQAHINFEMLEKQKVVEELRYVRHVRFDNELKVLMDGRKREALIHI